MRDFSAVRQASDLLYAQWMARETLASLPDACRPQNRVDGYAIQALLEPRSAHPLFGWKIAATSAAGQAHIGVSGPLAGRILRERTLAPGADVPLAGNRMRVAEVEFAFVMGQDLPPRSSAYGMDDVMAAVASLHPAIEIPDSRFADFVHAGEAQLIADNACAHLFMLGEPSPAAWRSIDLAAYEVQAVLRGAGQETHLTGKGANVLGDPRLALTWIANELSQLGITLKKGEAVTTGTCLTPIAVMPGDEVSADYGPFGSISARFV